MGTAGELCTVPGDDAVHRGEEGLGIQGWVAGTSADQRMVTWTRQARPKTPISNTHGP